MGRGRPRKYEVQELFKLIEENELVDFKIAEFARILDVCELTARKYVRDLQDNGMFLIPNRNGHHLAQRDESDLQPLQDAIKRLAGTIIATDRVSNVAVEVRQLPEVKKGLKKLDAGERGKLKKGLRLIGYYINAIEVEEGFE